MQRSILKKFTLLKVIGEYFQVLLKKFSTKDCIEVFARNLNHGGNMQRFKNQKGQGVMEYIILSTLVGIFCLVAMKQFGEVLKVRLNHMKSEIVRNLEIR